MYQAPTTWARRHLSTDRQNRQIDKNQLIELGNTLGHLSFLSYLSICRQGGVIASVQEQTHERAHCGHAHRFFLIGTCEGNSSPVAALGASVSKRLTHWLTHWLADEVQRAVMRGSLRFSLESCRAGNSSRTLRLLRMPLRGVVL